MHSELFFGPFFLRENKFSYSNPSLLHLLPKGARSIKFLWYENSAFAGDYGDDVSEERNIGCWVLPRFLTR
jgi:hypothetical protein